MLMPSFINKCLILPPFLSLLFAGSLLMAQAQPEPEKTAKPSVESQFISNVRQLTFEGRRAGEGYFNADGTLLVFQSERVEGNPFFQIFLLDFETGDIEPVSPGYGKTTCSWIHPDNNRVLFASTQDDPAAKNKQKEEIELRESGQQRRYSWDYDPTFELYAFDRSSKKYTRLTNAEGYDAEGSYSPDGKLIAFASNRLAYSKEMSPEQKKAFEIDPAVMMDIFIMNADGTDVRQLTDAMGYDGGPFFSPDGKRICWRRFAENGATAEVMTMNIDGTDQKQLTHLGAMSWAPFYHPSGKYLIFTTNLQGFDNFELYLVDVDGKSPPIRVTDTKGFDGLASFTPDGNKLTWTSNRNSGNPGSRDGSQIFIGDWNHQHALEAVMASTSADADAETVAAFQTGASSAKETNAGFDARDIMKHVDYLCRKELGGRMTGSKGERKATAYVAAFMDSLGLKPAGDNGGWFQEFDFPDGAELGTTNQLSYRLAESNEESAHTLELDKDWRPLTFSGNVKVDFSEVVFAGYGIVAPATDNFEEYDSYVHLDAKDKWVLVYRFVPEDVSPEQRQHLQFYGELRKKLFHARQNGARGLIVMSGPNSQVRNQLVPLLNDFSPAGSSIAAISVTDEVANTWLKAAGKDIKDLQTKLDDGSAQMGFDLKGVEVAAEIDIKKVTGRGRNVIGRLQAGDQPSESAILVGAHIDHLGTGKTGGSLAKESEQGGIHFGADDNASGVAAMLEVAEYLSDQKRKGKLKLKRDVIFAGWSGEELGLHGSKHFVESLQSAGSQASQPTTSGDNGKTVPTDAAHDFTIGVKADGSITLGGQPTTLEELEKNVAFIGKSAPDFEVTVVAAADASEQVKQIMDVCKNHGVNNVKYSGPAAGATAMESTADATSIYPKLLAALNMDMVGRFNGKLILQGIASSDYWAGAIESKNALIGLPITLSNETELPTDASSFYRAGVPILSAFTGSHTDYHTPRDTPEKLDYPDAARIAQLMGLITRSLATSDDLPKYIHQEAKPKQEMRGGLRAYLGTVPSYGDDVVGVKLSDVSKGGPAEKAGVKGGDIIVGLAGKDIENIYDYTAVLDSIKIGQETSIVVMRDGERLELKLTPGSRQ
jgi:Tol biopolymer transport system component/Zn-dependent M28 family amino/carboxypeptidase